MAAFATIVHPAARRRTVAGILGSGVVAVVAVVFLAGCSTPTVTPDTSSPASSSAGATGTATATPTQTPTISSTPFPPSTGTAAGPGCAATPGESMPAGATTALISDLDGDGKDDTEWMSQDPDFRFGITTASGATFSVKDTLAGPNGHNGWTATLGNGANVAVVDDGRTARLFGIAECRFVTPVGVDGKNYEFDMHNFRGNGTGVGCRPADVNGSGEQRGLATQLQLGGYQVLANADGTSTVRFTTVIVAPDSSVATNGNTTTVVANVAADDPAVTLANRSSCLTVPVVSTDGK